MPLLAGVTLVCALALTGCGGASDDGSRSTAGGARKDNGMAEATARPGASAPAGAGGGAASGSDKPGPAGTAPQPAGVHIIRTASVEVRVKDVPKALDQARTAVAGSGGIVADERTDRDSSGQERSRLVLRVPQDRYEEVLDALSGTGRLVSRSVTAEDVTSQVVDVDSRVKSQRASVARVRELMDEATALSDVVSLEGELSTREAELESLLAQQASLKDRTSLATITLSIAKDPSGSRAAKDGEDGDPGFLDALAGGWHALLTVLRWIAVALGALLPFIVPLALLLALWLKVLRPRTARRSPVPAVPPARTPGLVPYPASGSAADGRTLDTGPAPTAPSSAPASTPSSTPSAPSTPAGQPTEKPTGGPEKEESAGR